MGNCTSSGGGAGKGSAGGSGTSLPENITSEITLKNGKKYVINGNEVTSSKGNKYTVSEIEELNPKNKRDADALKNAKKAGIEDPVRAGRLIIERKLAEKALEQGKQEEANRQANMDKNVKGYKEIRDARAHNQKEYDKQKRSIERGERIYTAKKQDVEVLKKKYPRAAAYIEAEDFMYSSNWKKSSLGKEAMKKIRQGSSYKKALKEMKSEWSKYARSTLD